MSLHDSARPVDPARASRACFRFANTARAWGEDWLSVGRVTGDPGFRDFGQQHIGLSDWFYGLACRKAQSVAPSGAGLTGDRGGAQA